MQDVSAGLLAAQGPRQRDEQPAAELAVRLVAPLPAEVQAVRTDELQLQDEPSGVATGRALAGDGQVRLHQDVAHGLHHLTGVQEQAADGQPDALSSLRQDCREGLVGIAVQRHRSGRLVAGKAACWGSPLARRREGFSSAAVPPPRAQRSWVTPRPRGVYTRQGGRFTNGPPLVTEPQAARASPVKPHAHRNPG